MKAITQLCVDFSNHGFCGIDRDTKEKLYAISKLKEIKLVNSSPAELSGKKLLLVIVESRLFENLGSKFDITASLTTFTNDLLDDGYAPVIISASLYKGSRHIDGFIMLRMRDFFKAVRENFSSFCGGILVGNFPDALLLRRFPWLKIAKNVGEETISGYKIQPNDRYIACHHDIVASRAEIILNDLDGYWDNVYHFGPEMVKSLLAYPDQSTVWPKNGLYGKTVNLIGYEQKEKEFEDFFLLDEGSCEVIEGTRPSKLKIGASINNEVPAAIKNGNYPNPISIPTVLFSRINARNVAISPDPNYKDVFFPNNGLIGKNGQPQAIFAYQQDWHKWFNVFSSASFVLDSELERTLLIAYFQRNHKYRGGKADFNPQTTSISYRIGPKAPKIALSMLHKAFQHRIDAKPAYLASLDATLLDFMKWVKIPGSLRLPYLHSAPTMSELKPTYILKCTLDGSKLNSTLKCKKVANFTNAYYSELEKQFGGHPWQWQWSHWTAFKDVLDQYTQNLLVLHELLVGKSVGLLAPQLSDYDKSSVRVHLMRTIWKNEILKNAGGFFYLYPGSNANSPEGAEKEQYNSKMHCPGQISECYLNYLNGLAVLSRSKSYFDVPSKYVADALGNNEAFGVSLKRYAEETLMQANLFTTKGDVDRKLTYYWGLLGDWTLRLDYTCLLPMPIPKERLGGLP